MSGTDWLVLGSVAVAVLTYIGAWAWMDRRDLEEMEREAELARRLSPPCEVIRLPTSGEGGRR